MKKAYYVFSNSVIRRKDNTLVFETGDWESLKTEEEKIRTQYDELDALMCEHGDYQPAPELMEVPLLGYDDSSYSKNVDRKYIPVTDVDSLYVFGETKMNTRLLNFLSSNKIPMHIFNYYGFYSGTYYPREYLNSGALTVRQAVCYADNAKRLAIAQEFISCAASNILKNLKYYANRGAGVGKVIDSIELYVRGIYFATDVSQLMGIEGNIRQEYYSAWRSIFKNDVEFEKRIKRPPDNMINTLISFGNSLMYTTCLTEIYRTQLNPLISFLHEPGSRRFSLSLDIAEIFKPIFVDRIIFKLLNTGRISEKDFDKKYNYCYMKESARMAFVKEYEDKLKTTVKHRDLGHDVSYRRLIRLECYKLIKHLIEDKTYSGFRIWW